MGETTIEWADYSFNPWIGCANVSEGCRNCYAHTMSDRFGWADWRAGGKRKKLSDDYWKDPLRWDRKAARLGRPLLVFCASSADVFEDHPDVAADRQRLWELIAVTPNLIWLLLTKRPQNIMTMVPRAWHHDWPANVWPGTSTENQKAADERLPHLCRAPAPVRFVSAEPLLSEADLSPWMSCNHQSRSGVDEWPPRRWSCDHCHAIFEDNPGGAPTMTSPPQLINWVISGGESGAKARPSFVQDHRKIRDACAENGIPYLFKQWGEFVPLGMPGIPPGRYVQAHPHGIVTRVGKGAAGNLLDGVQHLNWPDAAKRELITA